MGDLLLYKPKELNGKITYYGTVEYSGKDQCLKGRVVGITSSVTYQAKSLDELQNRFKEAVEEYCQQCFRKGRSPQIPYKGMFNVRFPSDLHRDLAIYAVEEERNLNSVLIEAATEFLANHRKNKSE